MNQGLQQLRILFMSFLILSLTACAIQPLQAPCDENANFCGKKTKINTW